MRLRFKLKGLIGDVVSKVAIISLLWWKSGLSWAVLSGIVLVGMVLNGIFSIKNEVKS